jgi:hypothetical protein
MPTSFTLTGGQASILAYSGNSTGNMFYDINRVVSAG